jgi:hypothetical protein
VCWKISASVDGVLRAHNRERGPPAVLGDHRMWFIGSVNPEAGQANREISQLGPAVVKFIFVICYII